MVTAASAGLWEFKFLLLFPAPLCYNHCWTARTIGDSIVFAIRNLWESPRRQKEVRQVAPKQQGIKKIADNRKAFHEYFVLERFEAGIELAGTEVKSIRAGQVNLKAAFCSVQGGELFVRGMHISPYEHGNIFNKDPVRPRRLLMHKREILRLQARVMQDGVALIPLSLYFKDSRVKLELGLCKGKKLYDKRDSEAERQSKRDIDRMMKERTAL